MSQKIKLISFKKDETIIGFVESYQPRDSNDVANEKTPGKIFDLPRHADFERAMDKMKPHLLIACELQEATDCYGNMLQKSHFDDYFADSDEEQDRFGGLELTGIIIQGKNASDGVQLVGTKTTSFGEVVKLKSPSISLLKAADGYSYPLLDILDTQLDTLLHEAEEYRARRKHGAGVQVVMELPEPTKQPERTVTDQLDGVINEKLNPKKEKTKMSLAQ